MKTKYGVKLIREQDVEYVHLDNLFAAEEALEYALKHNFNIKFDCCTYTSACEKLYAYQEAGFNLKFVAEPVYWEGQKICDKVVVYCTRGDSNV